MHFPLELSHEELDRLVLEDCEEKIALSSHLNQKSFDAYYNILRIVSVFFLVLFRSPYTPSLGGFAYLSFALSILAIVSIIISGTVYVILNRRFQRVYRRLRCPLEEKFETFTWSLINTTSHLVMSVALTVCCIMIFVIFLDGEINLVDPPEVVE